MHMDFSAPRSDQSSTTDGKQAAAMLVLTLLKAQDGEMNIFSFHSKTQIISEQIILPCKVTSPKL